jgi:transposase InsO family protein
MAWRTSNVHEQRIEFVVAAHRKEKSLTELCAEFEISRPTGYQWLKRYRADGIRGVVEKSRRPHHSPRRTAAEWEKRAVELRRERPDWGARKIQHLLEREGIRLPGSTIHRIFWRHALVRKGEPQRLALQRFEREQPNQLWQMDFKGPKGWDQPVGPLSVLDDHSRYAVALENTGSTQAQGVQRVLERVFHDSGVPDEMLMDHGTPWFNTQGRLGWSQFTVWLMDQDVALHFSGRGHPQTQGKVERFHRSLTSALLRRGAGRLATASLVRRFSRGVQLCSSARGLADENPASGLAEKFAALSGPACGLALSGGQRSERNRPHRSTAIAASSLLHQQSSGRARGRITTSRSTHPGALSPHSGVRTRPPDAPFPRAGSVPGV